MKKKLTIIEGEPMLTMKEVCEVFKCSHDTVERIIKAGNLPGIKVGRVWRFHPKDVRKYIDDRTLKASSKPT